MSMNLSNQPQSTPSPGWVYITVIHCHDLDGDVERWGTYTCNVTCCQRVIIKESPYQFDVNRAVETKS